MILYLTLKSHRSLMQFLCRSRAQACGKNIAEKKKKFFCQARKFFCQAMILDIAIFLAMSKNMRQEHSQKIFLSSNKIFLSSKKIFLSSNKIFLSSKILHFLLLDRKILLLDRKILDIAKKMAMLKNIAWQKNFYCLTEKF